MRRKMTPNEKVILQLLKQKDRITYAEIEPKMHIDGHDKYWTTFSTICSLIQAGIMTSENKHPALYSLTAYGRSKLIEVL